MILLSSRPVGLDRSRIPLTFIIAEHVLCAMHHSMDLIARGCNWRILFVSNVERKGNKGDAVTGRRQSGTSVNYHFTNSASLAELCSAPVTMGPFALSALNCQPTRINSHFTLEGQHINSKFQVMSSSCDGTLSSSSSSHSLSSYLILRSQPLTN